VIPPGEQEGKGKQDLGDPQGNVHEHPLLNDLL
jgi:hypothetical protein